MIELLTKRLHDYRPRRIPGRNLVTRCGVVILIAEHGLKKSDAMPTILMMQRAERAGDPWSGDVSFPGGKQDASDANTRAAALRELHEETGFIADGMVTPIGRLSDRVTREHGRNRPMIVSPYVYVTQKAVALKPGAEAASLVWVPLSFLTDRARRTRKIWRVAGVPLPAPAIDIGSAVLWGLSLMMADELVRAGGLKSLGKA
ncbi:MAG: CoA pyrophosphatase [Rhodocyclaceae bacterium]|nr:CoA pyrophosphatase [Rhodocyclaceae bacterium]